MAAPGSTPAVGQTPEFGVLGPDAQRQLLLAAQRSTGHAAVLPDREPPSSVGILEAIAACALAVVGGLLARTWAGRTASPRVR